MYDPRPAPHPWVRQDGGPAGFADQRERVERSERVLRDVRRAVVGDVPVERVFLGRHDAGLDHRLRDVRACDQVVAGFDADRALGR